MVVLATAEAVAATGATIIAALIVALITAKTTNSRQERQLRAEADRQERQLRAEAERQQRELHERAGEQARQLAHDRELADLDDLRGLLDEATLVLDRAAAVCTKATAGFGALARHTGEERHKRSNRIEEMLDDARHQMDPPLARLQVRVGSDDDIVESFNRASVALLKMATKVLLHRAEDDADERGRLEKSFKEEASEFRTASRSFRLAAVKRAGTVIGTQTPSAE
jgi:hypothetical protein